MEDRLFADFHGENVAISDNKRTAKWNHVYSGGILFGDRKITEGTRRLRIRLNGSGHVCVGLIEKDPSSLGNIRSAYESGDMKFLSFLRFHKREILVDVKMIRNVFILTNENEPSEVKTFGNGVWIAIYIKQGDVAVTLDSDDGLRFHQVSGANIEHLPNMNPTAKLRNENPDAMCFIPIDLSDRCQIAFHITPIFDGNRAPPRRYHARFGISSFNFAEQSNSPSGAIDDSHSYKILNVFEHGHKKDCCEGYLTINIQPGETLSYKHSHDKDVVGTANIEDYRELFIVFELYRVSISIHDSGSYFEVKRMTIKDEERRVDTGHKTTKQPNENDEEVYDDASSTEVIFRQQDDQVEYTSLLSVEKDSAHVYDTCPSNRALQLSSQPERSIDTITGNLIRQPSTDEFYRIQNEQLLDNQNKIVEKLTNIETKIDSVPVLIRQKTRPSRPNSDNIRHAMQIHNVDLISNLDPFPFSDYLLQYDLITQYQYDELMCAKDQKTINDINRKLIGFLRRRSLHLDITKIEKALRNSDQAYLYYCFCDKE